MILKDIGAVVEGSILPGAVGMMKTSSHSQADNGTLLKKSFTNRLLAFAFLCTAFLNFFGKV